MFEIWFGPDGISRDHALGALVDGLGSADAAAMNVVRLASDAPFSVLQSACESLGFFVERRLVIARYWLSKADQTRKRTSVDDEEIDRLARYLPELSATTTLVFVEDAALAASHPVVKLAADASVGKLRAFNLPNNIEEWIVERVRAKSAGSAAPAVMSPEAVTALVARIKPGNRNDRDHAAMDARLYLRKIDSEIDKLLGYANYGRVEPGHVKALVASDDVADIFKVTDAISRHNLGEAFEQTRSVLARGESPLVVLAMIARHYRILIAAKENERLSKDEFGARVGLHPYPAGLALEQVRRMTMPDIEGGLRRAMQADEAIKTGAMDDLVALETLIAQLCG